MRDDNHLYQRNYYSNILIYNLFNEWKIFKVRKMIMLLDISMLSNYCYICLHDTYDTLWVYTLTAQGQAEHDKDKQQVLFGGLSLRLFSSKDTYKSTEIWCGRPPYPVLILDLTFPRKVSLLHGFFVRLGPFLYHIYIFSNFHHTTRESTCDTLSSSATNQGWLHSFGSSKRYCHSWRYQAASDKILRELYIYIYIYIYARSIKTRDYIGRQSLIIGV